MARQTQTVRSKSAGLPQSVHFGKFDGIVNIQPRTDIKPTELAAALNIDLDRDGFPWQRPGMVKVSANFTHSLYSDGTNCFCVQNGYLMTVNPDLSLSPVLTVIGHAFPSVGSVPDVGALSDFGALLP